MNMVLDMNTRGSLPSQQMIDYTWLGGAISGLKKLSVKDQEWKWAPFIIDIIDTIEYAGDVKEILPGDETSQGSVFDSLGGYVSIVGNLCPEGLYFPVSKEQAHKVMNKLAGIASSYQNERVMIPRNQLSSFYHIVPMRGPLETQLMEELEID